MARRRDLCGESVATSGTETYNESVRIPRIDCNMSDRPNSNAPADSPPARSRGAVIEDLYLPIRADLLTVAAGLDRIDCAGASADDDVANGDASSQNHQRLLEAIDILRDGRSDRAARLQMLFSRPYQPNWRQTLNVRPPGNPNDAPEAV